MLELVEATRWVEDELHQLRSSYGPTFTVQNDVVPKPDVATTFIGLHVSAEYEVQLTDNTELRSKLVVEENAFHLTDLRADWVSTLGVSMSDHFGLQAKFQYHFDNHPSLVDVALTGERGEPAGKVPVPLGKSDRVLTMALVVDFQAGGRARWMPSAQTPLAFLLIGSDLHPRHPLPRSR